MIELRVHLFGVSGGHWLPQRHTLAYWPKRMSIFQEGEFVITERNPVVGNFMANVKAFFKRVSPTTPNQSVTFEKRKGQPEGGVARLSHGMPRSILYISIGRDTSIHCPAQQIEPHGSKRQH
jgi:hypothetical protein